MGAHPIDTLERQIQDLLEGGFARLFRRSINARDIALLLLRAMEDQARLDHGRESKPAAPDAYAIYLHPDRAASLATQFPELPTRLAALIANLSEESGYLLLAQPTVSVRADEQLAPHQARVTAEHRPASSGETAKMAAAPPDSPPPTPAQNACLHIVDIGAVPLAKSVINIGRESNNDVVIGDAFVSRHHLQLRKRSGVYTLFDAGSRGGTMVNSIAVNEHRLQNGDVIRIGRTDIVYADDNGSGGADGTTQVLPPS